MEKGAQVRAPLTEFQFLQKDDGYVSKRSEAFFLIFSTGFRLHDLVFCLPNDVTF